MIKRYWRILVTIASLPVLAGMLFVTSTVALAHSWTSVTALCVETQPAVHAVGAGFTPGDTVSVTDGTHTAVSTQVADSSGHIDATINVAGFSSPVTVTRTGHPTDPPAFELTLLNCQPTPSPSPTPPPSPALVQIDMLGCASQVTGKICYDVQTTGNVSGVVLGLQLTENGTVVSTLSVTLTSNDTTACFPFQPTQGRMYQVKVVSGPFGVGRVSDTKAFPCSTPTPTPSPLPSPSASPSPSPSPTPENCPSESEIISVSFVSATSSALTWKVHNPNATPFAFRWVLKETGQNNGPGAIIMSGDSDVTISTTPVTGVNTLVLTWKGRDNTNCPSIMATHTVGATASPSPTPSATTVTVGAPNTGTHGQMPGSDGPSAPLPLIGVIMFALVSLAGLALYQRRAAKN